MPTKPTNPVPGATPGNPPTGVGVTCYNINGGTVGPQDPTVVWCSSGPWLIETQTGFFTYARVPKGTLATDGLTLSSAQPTYNLQNTELLVIWQAQVDSVKTTDNFTTSSFQQNQKFNINSLSSDYLGTTYGVVGDYDSSTMGPRGTVTSSKKFIKRQLWDNNTHTVGANVFHEDVLGTNYVMASGAGHANVNTTEMQNQFFTDFPRVWVPTTYAGTLLEQGQGFVTPHGNLYNMQGTYNPEDETFPELIALLDELGSRTTNFQWASIPPKTGTCGDGTTIWPAAPINSGPCFSYQLMGFVDGCSHYDVNRHDYS